ncbi:MAG: TIR domain-containing protein [Xanthomonadales bacterium]|nr:TIR domain-containing protein [Xanthomonadales bacterium]
MKPPFEAYSGRDAFIFVCYSHKDKEMVYPELAWLRDQGLNIWYDEGISPGEEWPERIAWAIENADKILFYISPDSTQSRICRDEVRLARTEGKSIVSVQLKPTELVGGLELTLGSSQAIVKDRYRTLEDYRDQLSSILLGSGTINLSRKARRSRRSPTYALIAFLVVIALSAFIYQFALKDTNEREPYVSESGFLQSSIAVLPLVDMTPGRDLEYLSEGLAEELIHGLAQVAGLNVIARTSSFHFKNKDLDVQSIGSQLGVDRVLEGSIRREDDQLRVTLQLINVEDGFHIWSKQFDGFMSNIFKLQDEIAQNVVSAVMPDIDIDAYGELTDVGTNNAIAYEAFLVGSYEKTQQTRDSMDRAIEQFKLAINHDPGYFRAYEGLINTYNSKGYYYGDREENLALAAQVLEQAMKLDPEKSNPSWFWLEQNILKGEKISVHFREGEELYNLMIRDRSHVANGGSRTAGYYQYGLLLAKSGLIDAAIEFMTPLEAIDPMSINIKLRLAEFYAAVYDYEKALKKYEDLLDVSPGYVQAKLDMFLIYGKLGRLGEAEAIRNELTSIFPLDLTKFLDAYLIFWRGDKEAAIASLDSLANSQDIPPNYIGVTYLAFGENEKAFSFFHTAADQDDPFVSELMLTQTRILSREQWLSIRNTDEFMTLMNRYGYDESWPSELENRANAITDYTKVVVKADGD